MDHRTAILALKVIERRLADEVGDISEAEFAAYGDEGEIALNTVARTGRLHFAQALLHARDALRTLTSLEEAVAYCLSLERQGMALDRTLGESDRHRGERVRAAAASGGAVRSLSSWKRRADELQGAVDALRKSHPQLSFERICTLVAREKGCSEKTLKRYTRDVK